MEYFKFHARFFRNDVTNIPIFYRLIKYQSILQKAEFDNFDVAVYRKSVSAASVPFFRKSASEYYDTSPDFHVAL